MLVVLTVAVLAGGVCATNAVVSPVQKVIELLQENKLKISADLEAEEQEMHEYSNYCDDEISEKGYSIKTADRTIVNLQAGIQDAEAQVESFSDEVSTIGTSMAEKEKQLGSATSQRMQEKADFDGTEKELVTSVDELERATMVIKREMSLAQGAPQAKVQKAVKVAMAVISQIVDASWVNEDRRKTLKNLMQTEEGADAEDDLSLHHTQATHSSNLVEQLEDLKEKAEETLSDARAAEMKQQHNFDMMAASLNDGLAVSKKRLAAAKKSIESMNEEKGKAKGELAQTQSTKSADAVTKATLEQECAAARQSWVERQASAKEEMAVIEKAKGILADRVKVFVQQGSSAKSIVLDDSGEEDQESKTREVLVKKMKELSRKFSSYALMEMVSAAASDPFAKIKGLIEEMIAKLINEANQEATQKGFCDEEMTKSKAAQADKQMKIEKLQSRLDKASATKEELEQTIKDLESSIAALDKGDAEAIKIRNEEHATYLKASKDFKDAAEAVEAAITVLKEYYEGALVQVKTVQAKQPTFGGAKSDASHAIISILEMSAEDFQRLYMETEQAEREAVQAYEKLMSENRVSKTAKEGEAKGAASEIKSLEVGLKNNKEDYDMTNKELDAVLEYLDKLKPQCEAKVMSYEDKKARREAEIAGLKEGLSILEGQGLALIQKHLRRA